MSVQKCGCAPGSCGCCEGTQAITPVSEINRPGLDALVYRAGTHGAFLETMKARLGNMTVPANPSAPTGATFTPLLGLTRRDTGDPAIALLDCWALVADVLTFYQERIANEGYLRTATERQSILQLGRLVNYALRPGVASSVYLAYTLNANQTNPVDIPAGSQSQSVPGPGETPQAFETSDDLTARVEWNNLQPRLTQPQKIGYTRANDTCQISQTVIYIQGTANNLNPGDVLLFNFSDGPSVLATVAKATPDFTNNWTKVCLQPPPTSSSQQTAMPTQASSNAVQVKDVDEKSVPILGLLTGNLAKPATPQLPSSAFLSRNVADSFNASSDTLTQALMVLHPEVAPELYAAWKNFSSPAGGQPSVYVFRLKASPFGATAPLKPVTNAQGIVTGTEEWPIGGTVELGVQFDNNSYPTPTATAYLTIEGVKVTAPAAIPSTNTELGAGSVTVTANDDEDSYSFAFSYPAATGTGTANLIIYSLENGLQQAEISDSTNTDALSVYPGSPTAASTSTYDWYVSLSSDSSQFTVDVDDLPLAQSSPNEVYLDAQYNQIQVNSWAAVVRSDTNKTTIAQVGNVQNVAMASYGITGKSTKLSLVGPCNSWLQPDDLYLSVLRGATVYAQSEPLQLAQQPYCPPASPSSNASGSSSSQTTDSSDVQGLQIELGALYDGLTSGRWIVVSGERTDIIGNNGTAVAGVTASELAMISAVCQGYNVSLPGDQLHTTITLARSLAYTYKRSTVTICANVIEATNGGTTNETLGNGDATQAMLAFALKQSPVTYVPASTPAGAASSLEVFVNNIQWQEVATLAGLGPKDRDFVTQTDNNGITTVIFGDGVQGARTPTGVGNVRATYRKGIGQPGNVQAGQITTLVTKPLGVNAVTNPLDATGGADADDVDQARQNTPIATLALDRLVSVQDYADFSRAFAGIGKASSIQLGNLVCVTIAGAEDVPIDKSSDLYSNLCAALGNSGDPALPVTVGLRRLKLMVLSANVGIQPDYQWDSVSATVRTELLSAFSFSAIDLAQPIVLSQVIAVMQAVEGVRFVDVQTFGGLPSATDSTQFTSQLNKLTQAQTVAPFIPSQQAQLCANGMIMGAELVYLTPDVPDTLILNPA